MTSPIHPDEHRRHLDNAAYQAAIERAAIQETGESTKEIEERTVKDGTVDKG
jgi:hypothetical protein